MTEITKPMMLDETGQAIVEQLKRVATGFTIIESSEIEVSFAPVGGKMYRFTEPLTSLTFDGIPKDEKECVVFFSTAETFTAEFPSNCEFIGSPSIEGGKMYCLSILNGIVVLHEVNKI